MNTYKVLSYKRFCGILVWNCESTIIRRRTPRAWFVQQNFLSLNPNKAIAHLSYSILPSLSLFLTHFLSLSPTLSPSSSIYISLPIPSLFLFTSPASLYLSLYIYNSIYSPGHIRTLSCERTARRHHQNHRFRHFGEWRAFHPRFIVFMITLPMTKFDDWRSVCKV